MVLALTNGRRSGRAQASAGDLPFGEQQHGDVPLRVSLRILG